MTHPPYGAPPGANPYDPAQRPAAGPRGTSAAPRPKVSPGRIAVIAGVAAVALVGSPLAFMAGRASAAGATTAPSNAPVTKATSGSQPTKVAASPTTETLCASGKLTGAVWSATVPTGWQCSGKQALGLSLTSAAKDTITMQVTPAADDSACDTLLSLYPTLVRLPDMDWGAQPAIVAERGLGSKTLSYRCTIRDGRAYLITGSPITGSSDDVRTAVNVLLATWSWT